MLFLRKFKARNENYQFQLNLDTQFNSNIKNSMVMFTLGFEGKFPFYGKFFKDKPKFFQKIKKLKFETQTNSNM